MKKNPLYYLFFSRADEEKPAGLRLSRSPTVWLYFIGNTLWGLACLEVVPYRLVAGDVFLAKTVWWIGKILAASFPTVVIHLRWGSGLEKEHNDCVSFFSILLGWIFIGTTCSVFLGSALEFLLSFLRIQHFFGIPIEKWN